MTPPEMALARRKAVARAVAGRSRVGGLALLDEPDGALEVVVSSWMPRPAAEVVAFCLQRENFVAIMPDRMQVLWCSTEVGELGGTYRFRWWLRDVVPITWVAFVDDHEAGQGFSDQQVRGPFRYFHHTHTAVDEGTGSRYTDTLRLVGPLGTRADRVLVRPLLRRTFRERHRRMRRLLREQR
ncbi:hypothetical protein [Pseudokineococcus sp. 1T1Z-3]|uniref:hypothetical protein n=1 Tax=Pseudokineococcus sp. 1T1Z-3 TaxID=3132745 RepID=UPI0030952E72